MCTFNFVSCDRLIFYMFMLFKSNNFLMYVFYYFMPEIPCLTWHELNIQLLFLIISFLFLFFLFHYTNSFYILDMNPWICSLQIFSATLYDTFSFCCSYLWCVVTFYFDLVALVIFVFVAIALDYQTQKIIAKTNVMVLTLLVFS